MDLYKITNVGLATAYDFNAPKYVTLKDRRKLAKLISRYARRKLKQDLNKEQFELESED